MMCLMCGEVDVDRDCRCVREAPFDCAWCGEKGKGKHGPYMLSCLERMRDRYRRAEADAAEARQELAAWAESDARKTAYYEGSVDRLREAVRRTAARFAREQEERGAWFREAGRLGSLYLATVTEVEESKEARRRAEGAALLAGLANEAVRENLTRARVFELEVARLGGSAGPDRAKEAIEEVAKAIWKAEEDERCTILGDRAVTGREGDYERRVWGKWDGTDQPNALEEHQRDDYRAMAVAAIGAMTVRSSAKPACSRCGGTGVTDGHTATTGDGGGLHPCGLCAPEASNKPAATATKLFGGKEDCEHDIRPEWSGVRCTRCGGWYCL